MKILVTGGHLAPALAFIDYVREQGKDEVLFVGRKYTNLQERSLTLEYREITARKIFFYNLNAGRFTRSFSLRMLFNLLMVPVGFLSAVGIILKNRPTVIMSFGGYLALPISLIGWVLRVPVYTHEQTVRPGLANRMIALVAKKIFLSFPESVEFLPKQKSMVTGNPVRRQIFEIEEKLFPAQKKPVLYITGGSIGSHSINIHIEKILDSLVDEFFVVHQVGNVTEYGDFTRLKKREEKDYHIVEHIKANEIGYVYAQADLVVSRAGANTFFELIALRKPSLLIPLPWSAYDEQEHHAQMLKQAGVAEVFHQEEPSEELLQMILKMKRSLKVYKDNFSNLETFYLQNAAARIYQEITS